MPATVVWQPVRPARMSPKAPMARHLHARVVFMILHPPPNAECGRAAVRSSPRGALASPCVAAMFHPVHRSLAVPSLLDLPKEAEIARRPRFDLHAAN